MTTPTTVPSAMVTLPLYPNTPVPVWEHNYIGITGIKLPVKLSSLLQPANWEVTPPVFVSCLEQIVHELALNNNHQHHQVTAITTKEGSTKGSVHASGLFSARKNSIKPSTTSSSSSLLSVLLPSSLSSSSSLSLSSSRSNGIYSNISPLGRSSSLNNLQIHDPTENTGSSNSIKEEGGSLHYYSNSYDHPNTTVLSTSSSSGLLLPLPPPPLRTSSRKLSRSISSNTPITPVSKNTESKLIPYSTTHGKEDERKNDEDIVVMMEIDQEGNIVVTSPTTLLLTNNTTSSTTTLPSVMSVTKTGSVRKRGLSIDHQTLLSRSISQNNKDNNNNNSSSSSIPPNVTFSSHTGGGGGNNNSNNSTTGSSKKNRKVSIGDQSTTYSSSLTSDEDEIGMLLPLTTRSVSSRTKQRSNITGNTTSNPPSDTEGGSGSGLTGLNIYSYSTDGSTTDSDSYRDVLTLIHRTELEEFHRQALRIDLAMNPLHGQSWLTSTLIDALLFRFACYFPNVTFLPCSFAAYELVQASRNTEKLRTLLVHDVLGRLVTIRPDQIGPIEEVPGYTRLPGVTTMKGMGSGSIVATIDPTLDPTLISPHSTTSGSSSLSSNTTNPSLTSSIATASTVSSASSTAYSTRQRTSSHRKASDCETSPVFSPLSTVLSSLPPRHHNNNKKFKNKSNNTTTVPVPTALQAKKYSLLGRNLYKTLNKPLIFFYNAGGNHWVVVRVDLSHTKRIELYEPMGKPSARANVYREAGLGLRSIPRPLLLWLDTVCPLPLSLSENGWKERSLSAITYQQQLNGFDCGVACLLYAEKCAQGLAAETICKYTDQSAITGYRELLGKYLHYITTPEG